MRKTMAVVAGVAVLCGTMAFAQSAPGTTATPQNSGFREQMQNIMAAHRDEATLHHALMEGKHDPAVLPLLSKALADRTTLLQAEQAHVTQLQAVVTALQSGDEAAVKSAREAAKAAMETVEADAKAFTEDCKAIREAMPQGQGHLGHRGLGAGAAAGTTAE